ncbi:MAG: alanine racemase [Rhodobacteraceae bacterium]|nr:alanine racemase [Paracoccaceae bacterium]
MARARLEVNLSAVAGNWRELDGMSGTRTTTGAVVKADAYGLGAPEIVNALIGAGARDFFVAMAEEGLELGDLPESCRVFVFSGYMKGDKELLREHGFVPVLCSPGQVDRFLGELPGRDFALQLNTGMNRLGIPLTWFSEHRQRILAFRPLLIVSHLACADEPGHRMNQMQLERFIRATGESAVPRSLAATGGILLGPDYHFDHCRPGIGIYGGLPFESGRNVVDLHLPVVQVQEISAGEAVGYGLDWRAGRQTRIATVLAGYADGVLRCLGNGTAVHCGEIACPVVGRISMDLVTVDVSELDSRPDHLQLLGPHQTIDALADDASTIGYEVLTRLGRRFERAYTNDMKKPERREAEFQS